jgi:hypothetical protein
VSLGAYKLVTCLPSPYVPASEGGAPLAFQIVDLSLIMTLTNPSTAGKYLWRVLVTPYLFGTATVDDASAFEVRTQMLFPYTLSFRVSYQPKSQTIVSSGRVLALGRPRAGVKVSLFAEFQGGPPDALTFADLGSAKTSTDGTFVVRTPRKRILQPGQTANLNIAALTDTLHAPCVEPPVAPAGCVDESLSPPTTTPPHGVTITIPALTPQGK